MSLNHIASNRYSDLSRLAGRSKQTGTKAAILLHDSLSAGFSLLLAYVLCDQLPSKDGLWEFMIFGPALFGMVAAAVFYKLRLHCAVWRHVSMVDVVIVAQAVTLAILCYVLLMFLLQRQAHIPRAAPLIQWSMLVIMLGGSRFAWRLFCEQTRRQPRVSPSRIPLITVGSGSECSLALRAIASAAATPYQPVGIIDPTGRNVGRCIQGIPVLGRPCELGEIVSRLKQVGNVTPTIVFAEGAGQKLRGQVREAQKLGCHVARMPNIVRFRTALTEGRIKLDPVPLHALIGRKQIQLDQLAVERFIGGNKILITGAGGSIGSELVRIIAKLNPAHVTLIDQCEYNLYAIGQELIGGGINIPNTQILADIRNRDHVTAIFGDKQPDLVFHAAALKHVPLVELNPVEGVLTNIIGTQIIAEAAKNVAVRTMVQISTDKAVNPLSVMGATKRYAELYCQALDTGDPSAMVESKRRTSFLTVRFGNVIGSSGSVVPLFQNQLSQGGPLTVTHPEMRRYFMTIREAAELVLHAAASEAGIGGERGLILVLDMGEPVRVMDIAQHIIRLAGREPGRDIEIRMIGARPGEKLVEELFDDREERIDANANNVFAARSRPLQLSVLRAGIDELADLCIRRDDEGVRLVLQSIVPGYARALSNGRWHEYRPQGQPGLGDLHQEPRPTAGRQDRVT